MKVVYFIFFLFCPLFTNGQLLDLYETEEYPDYGIINNSLLHNNSIFISGKAHDKGLSEQACIRKLDLEGTILWSTSDLDSTVDYTQVKKMFMSSDGYLYAYCQGSSFQEDIPNRIWKVDSLSGEILYKVEMGARFSDDIVDIKDLGQDILLMTINDVSEIIYFDKNTGEILDTYPVYSQNNNPRLELNSDETKLFYNFGDTIIQTDPYDINNYTWKTNIPVNGNYFSELLYEESTNSLYVFLRQSSSDNVFRLNADDGSIIWSVDLGDLSSRSLLATISDTKIVGDQLYVRSNNYLSGNTKGAISCINKTTGTFEWVSSDFFGMEEYKIEKYLDFDISASGIYITGYYDGDNSGIMPDAGKWAIKKLDLDGNLIFENSIYKTTFPNLNKGIGIFAFDDKVVCVGNKGYSPELSQEYVAIDPETGKLLDKKPLGGLAYLPSTTKGIEQLSNGDYVTLMQKGRFGHFAIRDLSGNILWDSIFMDNIILDNPNNYYPVVALYPVNDSLMVTIGHQTRIDIENGIPFTSFLRRFLTVWNINTRTIEFKIVDNPGFGLTLDPLIQLDQENGFFASINPEDSKASVFKLEKTGNSWRIDDEISPSIAYVSDNYLNREVNNKILLDLDENKFLLLSRFRWFIIDKSDLTYSSVNSREYIDFCHIDIFNDSLILFTAVSELSENLSLMVLNSNDLSTYTAFQIDGLQTKGVKWIKGEDDSHVYILSDDQSEVFVTKINVSTGDVLWTRSASNNNIDFPLIYASDIDFNTTGNYLVVTGYRENSTNRQAFFAIINSEGEKIADLTRNGDFPGNNEALIAHCSEFNNQSLIGGQLNIDSSTSSAFLFSINGEDLLNSVKGNVFYDLNENGQKDIDEPNIQLGCVSIDNLNKSYLNKQGSFEAFTGSGIHEITYKLLDNWKLTTDSITFHIDADNPNTLNDTLFFGIAPIVLIDSLTPFVSSEAFICDQTVQSFVVVKNTGTTIHENVTLHLQHPLDFIEASPAPDSIDANGQYWYFDDLFLPGTSKSIVVSSIGPDVSNIGNILAIEAEALLYDIDSTTILDTFQYVYQDEVLCAYDPNDKMAMPAGEGASGLTPFGIPIDYTIRFQNTGNYFARDVKIVDELDNDLDLTTFEFIGASHPISAVSRYENRVEFIFSDINLPDSTNNEPESHGFVSFRITPKQNLPESTSIKNEASIYFDSNPPILTNQTLNTLVSDLSVANQNIDKLDTKYIAHPNPTFSNFLFITSTNKESTKAKKWLIVDLLGREVLTGIKDENIERVFIGSLNSGIYFMKIGESQPIKLIVNKQ